MTSGPASVNLTLGCSFTGEEQCKETLQGSSRKLCRHILGLSGFTDLQGSGAEVAYAEIKAHRRVAVQ